MSTVFSKILSGELSCHRVFEDKHVLAFLDIAPLSPGHVLLIPKEAAQTLDALSDEAAAALGRVLPRLCRAVIQVTGCQDYNVLQNNGDAAHQAVKHVHFHIIPKPTSLEGRSEGGLGIVWQPQGAGDEDAESLGRRLRDALSQSS